MAETVKRLRKKSNGYRASF